MRQAVQYKLMNWGCLTLLIAPVGSIIFTALRQWRYAGIWLVLVCLWLAVARMQTQHDNERLRELFQRAFASRRCKPPTLNQTGHYGFPVYELTFDSPSHQVEAERSGATEAFKQIAQQRYAQLGGSSNPFDAERAIRLKSRS